MNVRNYFSEEEKQQIVEAIRGAEMNTSGEIRVHVEKFCKNSVLDRAAYVFKTLDMHKTGLRNGVLFYIAVEDRKFAVLGDTGINQKVPENFWEDIKEEMSVCFNEGKISKGLSTGIQKAGEQLKQFFPWQQDDVNELPDEISYEDSMENR
jgi:uncharacterized membrane protein